MSMSIPRKSRLSWVMMMAIAFLAMAGGAQALNRVATTTGYWSDSGTWLGGAIPGALDKALVKAGVTLTLVNSTTFATVNNFVVGTAANTGTFIIDGGSLTTLSTSWSAVGYNQGCTMLITGGGSLTMAGRLDIGLLDAVDGAHCSFTIDSGSVTINHAGGLKLGTSFDGSHAVTVDASIDGGVVTAPALYIDADGTASVVMDITGGTVIIAGDITALIDTYVADGRMTAYDGAVGYMIQRTYDGANTTIVAVEVQPTAPTAVQAMAGDASVALSWTAAAEDILDYYDITRSTTSGTGFALITNVTATSYTDLDVVNFETYYYVITAVYASTNLSAAEVSATPVSVSTGLIFDEDFTAGEGYVASDLAGQASWLRVSGTGTNAFDVDPSGDGFAGTAATTNTWDTTNGNAVVWSDAMANGVLDTWTGSVDFQMSTTNFPGLYRTNTWDEVIGGITNSFTNVQATAEHGGNSLIFFDIGLTPSLSDPLGASATDQVTLQFKSKWDTGGIMVNVMNQIATRTLLNVDSIDLGWDPYWAFAEDSMDSKPDFESDLVRLTYTIQKTKFDGYYLAQAVLSNLVTGVYTTNTTTQAYESQAAYDSSLMYFAMDKSFAADFTYATDSTNILSVIDFALDTAGLVNETNATEIVMPPVWASSDAVLVDDAAATLTWAVLDYAATSYNYNILRSVTEGGPYSQVGSVGANVSTYVDTTVNNLFTYYYVLQAVSDSVLSDYSSEESGTPAPVDPLLTWGGSGQTLRSATSGGTAVFSNSSGILTNGVRWVDNTIDALFEAGGAPVTDYIGNTMYGITQFEDGYMVQSYLYADDPQNEWIWLKNALVPEQLFTTNNATLRYVETVDMDTPAASLDLTSSRFDYECENIYFESTGYGPIATLHVALRQAGVWYLSMKTISKVGILALDDLGSTNYTWAVLDTTNPGEIMSIDGVASSTVDFTNVDAVGWFIAKMKRAKVSRMSLNQVNLGSFTGYYTWQAENAMLPPAGDMAGDFDSDGADNLVEFALNGDPTDDQNTGVSPTVEVVGVGDTNYLQYVHLQRIGDNLGIDYSIKESGDLVNEPMINDATIAAQYIGEYDKNFQTVTNLVPIVDDQNFIGLQLEEL